MKVRKTASRAVGLIAAACSAFAGSAGAQEQADRGTIEEIVVTAQFREQSLQDTPIAITAMDAELMEQRGYTDISDVAAQAPNVTLNPQPQSGGVGLIAFIRGIGQDDFNFALEPGVGIYVDDVYIPTLSSSLLELIDLERLEVLRGPQGTLAGKNSIGGAIKLFSKKPEGSGDSRLEVTAGSDGQFGVRGFTDFEVAENLYARISGMTRSIDGYVKLLDYGRTHPGSNVPSLNNQGRGADLGELGGRQVSAGRLALSWMPNDRLSVDVSGDYTIEDSDPVADVLLSANHPATTPEGIPFLTGLDGNAIPFDCRFVPHGPNSCDPNGGKYISYANFFDGRDPTSQAPYKPYYAAGGNEYEGWGVQGKVSYQINDNMELIYITSYREYEMNFAFDQDASPVPQAQLNNVLEHEAWSHEIRLNGSLADGFFDYTVGAFYFDQTGDYNARVDLNYAGIDFIHGPDETPSTSKAAFFNGTLTFTDAWTVNFGLRYSEDEKDYTYFRSNPDGTVPFVDNPPAPGVPPICEFFLGAPTAGPVGLGNTPNCLLTGLFNLTDSFEGDRMDYRLVSDYRFTDSFMLYGSISTGYKAGGVNPRPFFGPSAGECSDLPPGVLAPCNQLAPFEPEELLTYEVGFKADFWDRRIRLNGALFFNEYEDIILTLTECPAAPCLQPNNVGEAEVQGIEFEGSFFLTDGLRIDASYAYLDFEYQDVGTSGIPLDAITPYTPETAYSFGIQYDHILPSGASIGGRFDGSYRDEIYSDPFNTAASKADDYFVGNMNVRYVSPSEDWQVKLEVRNVFDKYYFHGVIDDVSAFGAQTGLPGRGRTWAVTLRRDFRGSGS